MNRLLFACGLAAASLSPLSDLRAGIRYDDEAARQPMSAVSGGIDLVLLVAAGILASRNRWSHASWLVAIGLIFSLGSAAVFTYFNGIRYFTTGFGSDQTLTRFLALLTLRVLLLMGAREKAARLEPT